MATTLERYGYRGEEASAVARVVSAHGDYYHLVCNEAEGELIARKKKSCFLNDETKPVTGDFVRFVHNPSGESLVTSVLPRFSVFERRDPSARRKSQTLAVNFDALFIMTGLDGDFSLPRLKRYLALASDIGRAEAVVVLTKCDVADPPAEAASLGCRTIAISSVTGKGLGEVREFVAPGKTVAMVGSSGVGKSTLLNALAGEEWAATRETQSWSGRGRHTTTSRELVMLPDGSMVVDTPGIREIGFVGERDVQLAKGTSTHRFRMK